MSTRTPGEGRYAQLEREQRWLAAALPDGVEDPVSIFDVYITGTRMRLRRMQAGDDVVLKLAQKVRPRPDSPHVVKLTNMYLSQAEYDALAQLGGSHLHKTRWHLLVDAKSLAVDRFEGHLDGLVLAEVELGDDEPAWPAPAFAVADVTEDDRYSGGALAAATPDQVRRLLPGSSTPG